jgi:hypothetical protein
VFERFTERARRVAGYAQEEARARRHGRTGTGPVVGIPIGRAAWGLA